MLFEYPKNATISRVLPKNKIYLNAKPSSSTKSLFINQVEQIIWQYKLAPETVNLASTQSVLEIQVFQITLKEKNLKHEVLHCIDQAISHPILFELYFQGKTKAIAAYKYPSETNSSKREVSSYFETKWLQSDTKRQLLPIVSDLGELYTKLLYPLIPFSSKEEELQASIKRAELIYSKQNEIKKCEDHLRKERQYNRKVEINAELRVLKHELTALTTT